MPSPRTLYYQKDPLPPTKPDAVPPVELPPTKPDAVSPVELPPAKSAAAPVERPQPVQVAYQDPALSRQTEGVLLPPSATRVTPPKLDEIKLQTESELRQDIIAEVKEYKQPAIFSTFPTEYTRSSDPGSVSRPFAPMVERVEPAYVCYQRLYFEDKNSERYGWEFGPLQPVLSAALFYKDMILWPYHIGTRPCQRYECSAGYCLPGDPVPYLIYPIEWSVTGGLLEAGTIVGLYAIFP
jgi:hypothetical protein